MSFDPSGNVVVFSSDTSAATSFAMTAGVNGVTIGSPLGYSGTIFDAVSMPADAEVVSANGTFTGIGAANMQVLSHGANSQGERFDSAVIEAMLDDDAVNAAVSTIKLGVLSGELRFSPSAKQGADPVEAKWAADFCDRAHKNLPVPIPIWAWDYLDYVVYGSKVAEKVLEEVKEGPDAGLLTLKSLKIKAHWTYHLCTDPYLNMIAVYAQTVFGPAYIESGHFLISSFGKRDADPRGTSILRGAKAAWFRKQQTLKARTKGDQQFGTPSIVMILPEGALLESQMTNLKTGKPYTNVEYCEYVLDRYQNGGSLALPFGSEAKVLESSRDGKQLSDSADYHDRAIVRAILLTAKGMLEPEHYTQGGGEHAKEQQRGLVDFIRDGLLADLGRQVFHYLLMANKGRAYADLYLPTMTIGEMPIDQFLTYASGLGLVLQSGGLTESRLDFALKLMGFPDNKPDELRIGPAGPIPRTITAPAGSVQNQEGKIEEYPAAPLPGQAPATAPAEGGAA